MISFQLLPMSLMKKIIDDIDQETCSSLFKARKHEIYNKLKFSSFNMQSKKLKQTFQLLKY